MAAIDTIQRLSNAKGKYYWVVEGDIKGCFDAIPHQNLVQILRKVVADEELLSLIWAFLKAGYIENDKQITPAIGTPQGGIASPLLANIYLHELDTYWQERYNALTPYEQRRRRATGQGNVQLVRYADDFLILTNGSKVIAEALKEEFASVLEHLSLILSPDKTLITHIDDGFDFLGFHIQRRPTWHTPQRKVVYVTPTARNEQRYKEKIQTLLNETGTDVVNKLRALNRVILGWATYYQYIQASSAKRRLDYWTYWTVWEWLQKKHSGMSRKALYQRYMRQTPEGRKALGYGKVFLKEMETIPQQRYYQPSGGRTNLYLTVELPNLTIHPEEPIETDMWTGTTTQNAYAIARQDLLMQKGAQCQRCGRTCPPEGLHVHHMIAQREGGKHNEANLQLYCQSCHAQTESYGRPRRKI
jgi:group II intron reverse transcriptase/maturase